MSREMPDGWSAATVEDVAEILDSKRVPLNSEERRDRKGSVPYWGANGIVDYIDQYIFDEPLILMAEDGGYFDEASTRPICHRIDGRAWVNNHAHVIRATKVERDWFYYWFVHRDITPHIKGGTRSKLNQKDLRKLPIHVPPLAEQRRIAEILSSVDEAIQATQAVIEQTRKVKDGVLERLLTKGIGHTRFKQTEIGEIPEGWEAKALGEVCELSGGAGFPIKHQGRNDLPYPFIKVSDMNLSGNEKFIIEYNNTIDEDIAKALKARPFPKGATIFPKVGAALLTNKRRILTRPTFADNNIMVANPSSELDSEYLYHCFCRLDFSEYVQSGAVPSINQGTVGAIPIPVPPLSEQKGIADILRALDETEERLATEMAQRHQLKASLSSDLLTGRRRVSASLPLAAE